MRYVTGKIRIIEEEPEETPAFSIISHTAPLIFGNSGGPLFDRQGRLVGINVTADGKMEWLKYAVTIHGGTALRPDLAWLRKKIAEDQAQLSRP